MPSATLPPVIVNPNPQPDRIQYLILARLVALNSTDPQLIALLAAYQTATGQAFGT
jgi:hypothetical protein